MYADKVVSFNVFEPKSFYYIYYAIILNEFVDVAAKNLRIKTYQTTLLLKYIFYFLILNHPSFHLIHWQSISFTSKEMIKSKWKSNENEIKNQIKWIKSNQIKSSKIKWKWLMGLNVLMHHFSNALNAGYATRQQRPSKENKFCSYLKRVCQNLIITFWILLQLSSTNNFII